MIMGKASLSRRAVLAGLPSSTRSRTCGPEGVPHAHTSSPAGKGALGGGEVKGGGDDGNGRAASDAEDAAPGHELPGSFFLRYPLLPFSLSNCAARSKSALNFRNSSARLRSRWRPPAYCAMLTSPGSHSVSPAALVARRARQSCTPSECLAGPAQ